MAGVGTVCNRKCSNCCSSDGDLQLQPIQLKVCHLSLKGLKGVRWVQGPAEGTRGGRGTNCATWPAKQVRRTCQLPGKTTHNERIKLIIFLNYFFSKNPYQCYTFFPHFRLLFKYFLFYLYIYSANFFFFN